MLKENQKVEKEKKKKIPMKNKNKMVPVTFQL